MQTRVLRSGVRQQFRQMMAAMVVCGASLAAVACGGSSSSGNGTPTGPTPSVPQTVAYVAFGASDAAGVGSTTPCLPLTPCPSGTGYVPVFGRTLTAAGYQLTLTNLGIPGAVLSPEMQALSASAGNTALTNLVQHQLPQMPAGATLVTVFAGGNDTNVIAAAVERGLGGNAPAAYVDAQVRVFGSGMETLLRGIRDRAPSARLIVLNLPNMAGLPYARGYSALRRQAMQRASVGMTTEVVNRLVSQNLAVVDLMCDARVYESTNLSSDGFHPNDAGYALLAELVHRAFTAGSAAQAPAAACGPMNVVPAF